MKIKAVFKEALQEFFEIAAGLIGKTGEEKMDFVLEQICNLDNATPLAIIPDKLEEFALKELVQTAFEEYKEFAQNH